MSICSPPPCSIAIPYTRTTRSDPVRLARVMTVPSFHQGPTFSSCIYSSKPSSGADGSDPSINGFPTSSCTTSIRSLTPPRKAVAVFVTLPPDTYSSSWLVTQRQMIIFSLRALAFSDVEGVVVEVWWGIVERDAPGVYDWAGYLDIVQLAQRFGLKVLAIMAFYQCGVWCGDPCL